MEQGLGPAISIFQSAKASAPGVLTLLSPFQGVIRVYAQPGACAPGFILLPLRGFNLSDCAGNPSFGQLSYQLQIGFQEIEGWQLAANGPAHVFENPVLDFAFVLAHRIEAQFDC